MVRISSARELRARCKEEAIYDVQGAPESGARKHVRSRRRINATPFKKWRRQQVASRAGFRYFGYQRSRGSSNSSHVVRR